MQNESTQLTAKILDRKSYYYGIDYPLESIADKINARPLFGGFNDIRITDGIPLDKIAIQCSNATVKDDSLFVEIKILGTPEGNLLNTLLAASGQAVSIEYLLANVVDLNNAQTCNPMYVQIVAK